MIKGILIYLAITNSLAYLWALAMYINAKWSDR